MTDNREGISVVITTYNRSAVLAESLERFDKQTLDTSMFEVIVADDGSTDDTPDMVKALQDKVSYELRHLRHQNSGIGYTSNAGIRASRFKLVALIADDIWPEPRFLEAHLRSHREHPEEHVGVLGHVEQSPFLPDTVVRRFWDPFQYGRFAGKTWLPGIYFHGCNISAKRSFLLEHGMFRQRRGIAHEDIELGYRLSQQGFQLVYDLEALVYHHHEETLDGICRRAYERGLNFGLLSDNVPPEVVFPLYKFATLQAGPRAFLAMLPREVLRRAVFNGVTVKAFWVPALHAAENNWIARLFATSASYRGVAGYYLRAGFREKQRRERGGELASQV